MLQTLTAISQVSAPEIINGKYCWDLEDTKQHIKNEIKAEAYDSLALASAKRDSLWAEMQFQDDLIIAEQAKQIEELRGATTASIASDDVEQKKYDTCERQRKRQKVGLIVGGAGGGATIVVLVGLLSKFADK